MLVYTKMRPNNPNLPPVGAPIVKWSSIDNRLTRGNSEENALGVITSVDSSTGTVWMDIDGEFVANCSAKRSMITMELVGCDPTLVLIENERNNKDEQH